VIRRTDVKRSRYTIAGAVSMLLSRRGLKLTAGMVVGWIVLERLVWPLLQMIVFSIAIVALLSAAVLRSGRGSILVNRLPARAARWILPKDIAGVASKVVAAALVIALLPSIVSFGLNASKATWDSLATLPSAANIGLSFLPEGPGLLVAIVIGAVTVLLPLSAGRAPANQALRAVRGGRASLPPSLPHLLANAGRSRPRDIEVLETADSPQCSTLHLAILVRRAEDRARAEKVVGDVVIQVGGGNASLSTRAQAGAHMLHVRMKLPHTRRGTIHAAEDIRAKLWDELRRCGMDCDVVLL
jgi:hypothetical protein